MNARVDVPAFCGLPCKEDSLLEGVWRLLFRQHQVMLANVPGTMDGQDPECLHDFRVALRRFRNILRFVRGHLERTAAQEIDGSLGELSDRLGPIRDVQVWREFLESASVQEGCRDASGWSGYLASQCKLEEKRRKALPEILAGALWRNTSQRIDRFLVQDMPQAARVAEDGLYRPFAARKVRKIYKRILKRAAACDRQVPEELHALRKVVRRGRYWAEFASPVLGKSIRTLTGDLKRTADALGDVHDMDVHLARMDDRSDPCPESLRGVMEEKRGAALVEFERLWKRIDAKSYRRGVLNRLGKHAKGG